MVSTRGVPALGLAVMLWCGGCRIGFDSLVDGDGGAGTNGDATSDAATNACEPAFAPFEITSAGLRNWLGGLGWNGTTGAIAYVEDPANASAHLYRTFRLDGSIEPAASLGVVGPSEAPTLVVDDAGAFQIASVNDSVRNVVRSTNGAPTTNVSSAGSAFSVRIAALPGGAAAYLWARLASGTDFERKLTVLDGTGSTVVNAVAVGGRSSSSDAHAIAWTGTEMLVLYADGAANRLMLQRVSAAGAMIGSGVELAAEAPSGIAAKWTGDRLLVAWHTHVVKVAYVAADGTLLTPVAEAGPSESGTYFFDVEAGPASDLVMWNTWYEVKLVPVARDGTVGAVTSLGGESIDAAWAGTSWLVGVSTFPGPGEIEIRSFCP